mgnify:CR=1 FL=1
MARIIKLILLGAPGAGKGTQAVRIVEKYNVPHISTGDIFRENIKNGTELGKKAQEYMNKGELVPDDLVIEIATTRLLADDCKNGFLLDGFPRTVYQAEKLDEFLAAHDSKIDKVLDIAVNTLGLSTLDHLGGKLTGKQTVLRVILPVTAGEGAAVNVDRGRIPAGIGHAVALFVADQAFFAHHLTEFVGQIHIPGGTHYHFRHIRAFQHLQKA